MTDTAWIVETTVTTKEAQRLAHGAVAARVAACANVHEQVASHYWWKGRVEEERESLIVFKTTKGRVADLVAWLRKEHPYEVPYIGAGTFESRVPAYSAWMRDVTATAAAPRNRRRPTRR